MMTKWKKPNMSESRTSEWASVQMLHRTCLIQLANHTIGNECEYGQRETRVWVSEYLFFILFYFFRSCYCWLRIILLILLSLLLLLVLPIVDFFECVVFRSFARSFVLYAGCCRLRCHHLIFFWCVSLFHPDIKIILGIMLKKSRCRCHCMLTKAFDYSWKNRHIDPFRMT